MWRVETAGEGQSQLHPTLLRLWVGGIEESALCFPLRPLLEVQGIPVPQKAINDWQSVHSLVWVTN